MKLSVENGDVTISQENFRKIYFHWINNLRDWCISRQIWFGHRIPVWYKGEEIFCDVKAPNGEDWKQDEDVLDTWFSSALWTFSTLGWPEDTTDLQRFHPTSFMSPAYEILPLWVSRMILMSGFHLGETPFKTVLIHGLVRDSKGRKFSKSLNNGVDPVEMIQKYGADALRMGLLSGTAIGNDLRFDEQKVKGYKNFANKIWNATRFVLEKTLDLGGNIDMNNLNENHKNIYNTWQEKLKDITNDLENYRLHLASEKLYDYFWHTFADIIIEECKKDIIENTENKISAQTLLLILLREQIISLHPFMPFITEEVWRDIKNEEDDILMITRWIA
ncbi:MAG: valyl-tRNA synthetase, valyl-tRNA synthetase [Candidatus Parcubacteria bacterium]